MNAVLLDSHTLLWWLENDGRLSDSAREVIEDPANQVLVSAASLWELAIKHHSGKLKAPNLIKDFQKELDEEGFVELPIMAKHAIRAALLPAHHRDPFDRVLIAQSELENAPLVSRDAKFDEYGIQRIW